MKQHSDTGVEVELLQEYIFVTLNNFKKVLHNRGESINNELEAWFTFLSSNEPEHMIRLIEQYPKFKEYYEEMYEMQAELDLLQEKKTALEEEIKRSEALIKILADAERIKDIQNILADSKYREKLYKEFGL